MARSIKIVPAGFSPKSSWEAVHKAVESNIDPVGVVTPLMHAQLAWMSHPQELAEAMAGFTTKMLALNWHAWRRAMGMPSADVERPHPDDTRFTDPVWQDAATWDISKEWYLTFTHHSQPWGQREANSAFSHASSLP